MFISIALTEKPLMYTELNFGYCQAIYGHVDVISVIPTCKLIVMLYITTMQVEPHLPTHWCVYVLGSFSGHCLPIGGVV